MTRFRKIKGIATLDTFEAVAVNTSGDVAAPSHANDAETSHESEPPASDAIPAMPVVSADDTEETILPQEDPAGILVGTDCDDTIVGSDLADIVHGGAGNDILTGGAGADVFVFDNLAGGSDMITDFDVTEDVVSFSGLADSYAGLTIIETSEGALVTVGAQVVLLANVEAAALSANSFAF